MKFPYKIGNTTIAKGETFLIPELNRPRGILMLSDGYNGSLVLFLVAHNSISEIKKYGSNIFSVEGGGGGILVKSEIKKGITIQVNSYNIERAVVCYAFYKCD